MAKKFHQSMKDRVHEGVGEDMYLLADSKSERSKRAHAMYKNGMISEDHSAIANLPQGVKMMSYAKTGPWMRSDIDDTIEGVDKQMDRDDSKRSASFKPHKY